MLKFKELKDVSSIFRSKDIALRPFSKVVELLGEDRARICHIRATDLGGLTTCVD